MSIQPTFTEGRPPKVCTLESQPATQLMMIMMLLHAASLSVNLIPHYAGSSSHILNAIKAPTNNEKSIASDQAHMWTLAERHQATIAMHESAHGTYLS
jgi:hypothetical protein